MHKSDLLFLLGGPTEALKRVGEKILQNAMVQKPERKRIGAPHLLLFFKILLFSATVMNFERGGLTQLLTLEKEADGHLHPPEERCCWGESRGVNTPASPG